jgi:tetratricopeptide (TPR) repeat protein
MNFEGNQEKAFAFIESTPYNFKKNHYQAYMAVNLYLNHQQSSKALSIVQEMEISDAYLPLPFWQYEIGYAYINELKLEKAQKAFTEFVSTFKGKFYVKDAYERLSWIAYIQGDTKKAAAYRSNVLSQGNQTTDADKLAFQNAKKGNWPHPVLLKARLLSDGGYQSQALTILAGKTSNDFERMKLAQRKAIDLNCSIILKGHHTLVAFSDGDCYFNSTGNAGMATAGSGDVLSGIITSLVAQSYKPLDAAIMGVYLHGLTANIGAPKSSYQAFIASDIIENIGNAYIELIA